MADNKPGLWANIRAKRQRGEAPAKPGDKDYPDAKNWKKVTAISEKKGTAAWQKAEGKNPEGGLNEKGRASLKAQGHDIKRPQPEGGARKDSFCARMKGMKSKLTSSETANDPDSRINKSLRKWKCGSFNFEKESNVSNSQIVINAFTKSAEGNNPFVSHLQNISKSLSGALSDPIGKLQGLSKGVHGYLTGQGIHDTVKNMGDRFKNLNPVSRAVLIGSLTGAGAGGLSNLAFGDRNQGFLKRLGKGALIGTGLGAGAGAGQQYIASLLNPLRSIEDKGIKNPATIEPNA